MTSGSSFLETGEGREEEKREGKRREGREGRKKGERGEKAAFCSYINVTRTQFYSAF